MAQVGEQVSVPVKSAWSSKINITQVLAFLATGGVGIVGMIHFQDPATAGKVTASVAMFGQVITFVFKTWFTNSVVASSTKS